MGLMLTGAGARGFAYLCACLAACAILPSTVVADWDQVAGSSNIDPSQGAGQPIITGADGIPFVLWIEPNGTNVLEAERFLDGTWSNIGPVSVTNPGPPEDSSQPSVATIGAAPYVAWVQRLAGNHNEVYVEQFANGAWTPVGPTALNVDPNHQQIVMAPSITGVNGVPYVAWVESNGSKYEIYVKEFTNGSWSQVGTALNVNAGGSQNGYAPMITSVGGVPNVVWQEDTTTGEAIYVKQFTNGAWSQVGTAVNLDIAGQQNGQNPSITSVNGVPYVAWSESPGNGINDQIYV